VYVIFVGSLETILKLNSYEDGIDIVGYLKVA